MGGLDARYLISKLGYEKKVASLTMIATPNRGSPIAQFALSVTTWSEALKKTFGFILGDHLGKKQISDSIYQLTPSYLESIFNKNIKDRPEVYYQSWSGVSSFLGINSQDQIHPLLLFSFSILNLYFSESKTVGFVDIPVTKLET